MGNGWRNGGLPSNDGRGGLWGQPQPRRWHGFPFNFCISLVQRSGQTKATPDPKEAEEVDMVGAAVC
jgi:hypothetical protein